MPERNQDKTNVLSKEQKDDLLMRVDNYIRLAKEQLGTQARGLSKEAKEFLLKNEWKDDNELGLAVKRACILSESHMLEVEDFDVRQRQAKSIAGFVESRLSGFMRNIKNFEEFNLFDMVIPEVERSLIMMVLKETNGNQIRTSKLLGINRNTLRSKIRKLGIKAKK